MWANELEWERNWHGNCVNSYNEETKQFVYAKKMGLKFYSDDKTPYNLDLKDLNVLDIGGGPYSILLKSSNFKTAIVADPCAYPDWVRARYKIANIEYLNMMGEALDALDYLKPDMTIIYNVLQHVSEPEKIIKNAINISSEIRIFEWIEKGISKGHPNNLTKYDLDNWLGGTGKTEDLSENGCFGKCYYGIFKGKNYTKTY